MNTNTASLDRLHDIIVPAPVPWWPPAPGWYWVLGFLLVVVLVIAVRAFLRWQRSRYRREALAELVRLEHQLATARERATVLLALSELLKRTALTAFPREQVAMLTGVRWFAFLDRTAKGAHFSGGLGAMLENAVYSARTAAALDPDKLRELTKAIRHWIKHHRTDVEQPHRKAENGRLDDAPSPPLFPSGQNPSMPTPC